MTYENFGSLDTSIQEKIDADTDFQSTLADLSDEDKETAIKDRKSELLDIEIKALGSTASEATKAKELANNYKIRAENAEKKLKGNSGAGDTAKNETELSSKDTLVFINAKVTDPEDIDEVIEYAQFKKISIADALKSNVIKASLADKAEKRKTAEATSTGTSRRNTAKVSDADIVDKASKGEIPKKGSAEAEQLFWARRTKK